MLIVDTRQNQSTATAKCATQSPINLAMTPLPNQQPSGHVVECNSSRMLVEPESSESLRVMAKIFLLLSRSLLFLTALTITLLFCLSLRFSLRLHLRGLGSVILAAWL